MRLAIGVGHAQCELSPFFPRDGLKPTIRTHQGIAERFSRILRGSCPSALSSRAEGSASRIRGISAWFFHWFRSKLHGTNIAREPAFSWSLLAQGSQSL